MKDIRSMEMDALFFGTKEEGGPSRASLRQKYGQRERVMVMLEPAPTAKPVYEP